jgi:multimeric flavodoxin WrbA
MKVLAINGSPHAFGCTHTALSVMKEELIRENIDVDILHIGTNPIRGCIGCRSCMETKKCVYDDVVNEAAALARNANGLIIASPVHFSGIAGNMKCFLDRFFYSAGSEIMANKAGSALVCLRRSGGSAALDSMNHYLHYSKMAVASSHYWNIVHGQSPEEIYKDEEGVQIIKTAAQNLAWLLKSIHSGNVDIPEKEPRMRTNFIR